jgi:hypothetical protein
LNSPETSQWTETFPVKLDLIQKLRLLIPLSTSYAEYDSFTPHIGTDVRDSNFATPEVKLNEGARSRLFEPVQLPNPELCGGDA